MKSGLTQSVYLEKAVDYYAQKLETHPIKPLCDQAKLPREVLEGFARAHDKAVLGRNASTARGLRRSMYALRTDSGIGNLEGMPRLLED